MPTSCSHISPHLLIVFPRARHDPTTVMTLTSLTTLTTLTLISGQDDGSLASNQESTYTDGKGGGNPQKDSAAAGWLGYTLATHTTRTVIIRECTFHAHHPHTHHHHDAVTLATFHRPHHPHRPHRPHRPHHTYHLSPASPPSPPSHHQWTFSSRSASLVSTTPARPLISTTLSCLRGGPTI